MAKKSAQKVALIFSTQWSERYKQTPTLCVVIPGGLTGILQTLDISLNKSFKDRLCERWNNWMIEGQKSFTPAGNVRAASLLNVYAWVLDAWRGLSADMVARSFKKCGISNSVDGTEEEILWEETEDVPTTRVYEEDEDEGVYAAHLTSEEWQNLFRDSDDEEFAGFGWAVTVLALKTAPLGATKLTKVNNEFNVSLFILFTYSLPFTVLSFFMFFSLLPSESTWSYLSH